MPPISNSVAQQIVGRERNQRTFYRQLVRNAVVARRVNSTVGRLDIMTQRTSLRIWFCLSLAAVAGGAAWTASMLLRAISGFRNAEAGSFLAIGRGVAEANQLSIAALYLALACAV